MESPISRSVPKSPARVAYEDCQLLAPRYLLADHAQPFITVERRDYFVDTNLLLEEAPQIVDEILIRTTLTEISEGQRNLLEGSVAVGLQYGLREEDMLEAADSISWSIGEREQFVKGLFTLISLKTAKSLHSKNISEGGKGISDDFDTMVASVSDAIISGYITFKYFDYHEGSGTVEYYNSEENKIYISDDTPDLQKHIFVLVHECRHAYQDILGSTRTIEETESEAHTVQTRFLYLAGIYSDHVGFEEPYEILPILDEYGEDEMPYVRAVNSMSSMLNEQRAELRESYAAWREDTIMEMYGISTSSKEDPFHQWYADLRFDGWCKDPWEIIAGKSGNTLKESPCESLGAAGRGAYLQQRRNKMYEACGSSNFSDYGKCIPATEDYFSALNVALGVFTLLALPCNKENDFEIVFENNARRYYMTDVEFITDKVFPRFRSYFDGL